MNTALVDRCRRNPLAACFELMFVMTLLPHTVMAASPQVRFDVSRILTAETSEDSDAAEEFAARNPDEQLISATITASALVTAGNAADLREVVFHFYSPDRSITMHDFEPKTKLSSDVVGNVSVTENHEKGKNLQLSVGGQFESYVQGSLGGSDNESEGTTFRFERLPEQELLSAAGLTARESGVYFKLRPTSQTSVEGAHRFRVTMRVQRDWRGGYLRAICSATSGASDVNTRSAGSASWLIPIHVRGDKIAKQSARRLSQAESELIRIAAEYRHVVERASRPTLLHELSLAGERIPDNWLPRLLSLPPKSRSLGFESRLPVGIRVAAAEFRAAKREVQQLGSPNLGGAGLGAVPLKSGLVEHPHGSARPDAASR